MNGTADKNPRDEAIKWFVRMHDDQRTAADERAFERWLGEEPAHEEQYERLKRIWKDVGGTADAHQVTRLRANARIESRSRAPSLSRLRRVAAAAVIGGAVATLALLGYPYVPIDRSYETAVGERRTIVLPDGSELTLNTDTQIRVSYDFGLRKIDLEQGQALFKVASNRWRPFLVDAGDRTIRAIGTEFDVYRKAGEVRVALIEGKISITPDALPPQIVASPQPQSHVEEIVLTAGRSVSITPAGAVETPAERIDEATAWLQGQLVFNDQPLGEAVAEINRYSTRKIVVVDEGLAELRVTGVFSTDRVDSFLEAVRLSLPVVVQRASDDTLLIVAAGD